MKILTPIDQSRRDGIVLPYCSRLAKALGAVIVVIHAVPITRSFRSGAMRQAAAYVSAVEEGLHEQGIKTEGVTKKGDPASVIVSVAGELDVDLIAMVSRGRNNLGKLMMGSVTDSVLANCPKPVLLLSEHAAEAVLDEQTRLQSAYLGAVVWHRQMTGVYTLAEAEMILGRLAAEGLDKGTLVASYEAQNEQDGSLAWLDIGFQTDTLRRFLPEEVDDLLRKESPRFQDKRAA